MSAVSEFAKIQYPDRSWPLNATAAESKHMMSDSDLKKNRNQLMLTYF